VAEDCIKCPVFAVTHEPYCRGTPYGDYWRKPSVETATAELAFLTSLIPEDAI
jgi:hypothetical protein